MNFSLLLPLLNHLLAEEPWTSQQLQLHAGKVICIDMSVYILRLKISAQGYLETVSVDTNIDTKANVTIHIKPADLPLIIQDTERAISYVKIEGDADLAQTVSEVGKNLRLDAEHHLSLIFGDIVGRRLAISGKAALTSLQSHVQKCQENIAEYFLEENPLLVRPESVTEFTQDVNRIRDDVERLIKRIEKLEFTQKYKRH